MQICCHLIPNYYTAKAHNVEGFSFPRSQMTNLLKIRSSNSHLQLNYNEIIIANHRKKLVYHHANHVRGTSDTS